MDVTIRIRENVVNRLRETRGIKSEEAFAEKVGTDRKTLRRIIGGAQPSGGFMARFCHAFDLGIGEVFEIVPTALVAESAGAKS